MFKFVPPIASSYATLAVSILMQHMRNNLSQSTSSEASH